MDIVTKKSDSLKAVAYLDGIDARIFTRLTQRLGSQEKAQNAIILVGLFHNFESSRSKASLEKIEKIKLYFIEELGMPFDELDYIIDEY